MPISDETVSGLEDTKSAVEEYISSRQEDVQRRADLWKGISSTPNEAAETAIDAATSEAMSLLEEYT
jgi:hypothetical protein